ncbi:MAG: ABC transporter permease subunit [Bacteriovoracaceae bacterium]|nr:ABC transporter permease subunit [Bacteriovoracaceae bacterium]
MEKISQKASWGQFWYDPKKRGYLFQFILFITVIGIGSFLVSNTQQNLARQNIASGFDFLGQEAGFEISESSIDYWADDSYQRALLVGILNTIKIALVGNFFAIILGVFVGIFRLSPNWLLNKISETYIEVVRNIPLLLQLFFWYAVFTEIFPDVKESLNPLPGVFVSQRGLFFPIFKEHFIWKWVWITFFTGIICTFGSSYFLKKKWEKTGQSWSLLPFASIFLLILPFLVWIFGGAPHQLDIPELGGFNFSGGMTLTPEFVALMLGLVLYTGAFNAEIVRAGIQSVSHGQWEASQALGLSRWQTLRLVVLPQSLRVIIPPMTSQVLNLIKNSSLAVGIGYPDFVAVANTTMNQTGQAIEAVVLIMAVYLFFSLSTSFLMNYYNRSQQLKERGA